MTLIKNILADSVGKKSFADIINRHRPDLKPFEDTYRDLHRNPELSCQEGRTSSVAADHLKKLGFRVHESIGGYGVIGLLRNGEGPTVLLRADMDALPVQEKTGLDYASTKTMKDLDGIEVPVMHACGHDTHVTCLMATASLLYAAKSAWNGSLICLFQPAEELVSGAQAMIDGGLYTDYELPIPDIILGQHVSNNKSGMVNLSPGPILAAVDGLEIRIFGKGGHGSLPSRCIDPIVIASHVVVRLQTIVSREVEPGKVAVVTCGSFQGGAASNVIPDYVDLKLTVRSYETEVQTQLLNAIKRIVRAECDASRSPQAPEFKIISHAPATNNSAHEATVLRKSFLEYFKGNLGPEDKIPGSEDFSILARAIDTPYVFWFFGGEDPSRWDKFKREGRLDELPFNHSSNFAPVIEPTLKTAVDALALAALTFLS